MSAGRGRGSRLSSSGVTLSPTFSIWAPGGWMGTPNPAFL